MKEQTLKELQTLINQCTDRKLYGLVVDLSKALVALNEAYDELYEE